MSKFKQLAADSTQLSELYKERKKLETRDVVGKELTISDFDMVSMMSKGKMVSFAAVTFEEMEGFVYNAGLILTKMITAWVDEYDTVEQAREAYKAETDKVKVKLTETKTKDDIRNLVAVELL